MACNPNPIYEGAVIGLFILFHEKSTAAKGNASTSLSMSRRQHQGGKLTSESEVISYLLATYRTDDINTEADIVIMNFKQPASQSTVDYAEAPWTNVLLRAPVYDRYCLDRTFIQAQKVQWDNVFDAIRVETNRHR